MNFKSEIFIDGTRIANDSETYFIADIAANHDGDLNRAKDLIWMAKEAGANAAKFQHFKASSIVSDEGFKALKGKQSHQGKWKKSVFEVYQDATVSLDWTDELIKTAKEADITFFTSPYAFDLVDAIDPYVPAYKIGSGDITWIEMVEYIANKNKPYIIASGASSMEDVVRAVEAGSRINPALALMQCNTNYTASLENMKYIQLNVLKCYREMFPGLILGLSDHTKGHASVLGSIALGARMIEKHFTDDVNRDGPDHAFSMTPTTWKEMVERGNELEAAMGNGIKRIEGNELETVILQRRSICASRDLAPGDVITKECIEVLRPCPKNAVQPYEQSEVLGRSVRNIITKGTSLRWEDLA